jgi:hypothetical protein
MLPPRLHSYAILFCQRYRQISLSDNDFPAFYLRLKLSPDAERIVLSKAQHHMPTHQNSQFPKAPQ